MINHEHNTSIIHSLEYLLAEYEQGKKGTALGDNLTSLAKHHKLTNTLEPGISRTHRYINTISEEYSDLLVNGLRKIVSTYYKKISAHNHYSKVTNIQLSISSLKNNKDAANNIYPFETQNIPSSLEKNQLINLKKITLNDKEIIFTKREFDCINSLMNGLSAKQTAYQLNISTRTVECHLENIRRKTKCRTKIALVGFLSKVMMQ